MQVRSQKAEGGGSDQGEDGRGGSRGGEAMDVAAHAASPTVEHSEHLHTPESQSQQHPIRIQPSHNLYREMLEKSGPIFAVSACLAACSTGWNVNVPIILYIPARDNIYMRNFPYQPRGLTRCVIRV